jgi:hypothetical protein
MQPTWLPDLVTVQEIDLHNAAPTLGPPAWQEWVDRREKLNLLPLPRYQWSE